MDKINKRVYLIFLLLSVLRISREEESSLKAVVVVFRHGERTILEPYPTDPYGNKSNWELGYGQLRNIGKMHHYLLGKWFRKRYNGFLPEAYSPDDILVQSTDLDRVLMSASAHLAGLYPPPGNQLWNTQLNWQPIPIHTKPRAEDPVVAAKKPCPRYQELYSNLVEKEMQKHRKELDKFRYYVSYHTGLNYTLTFEDLSYVYVNLYVEKEDYGLELPSWTKTVYPEPLRKWSKFSFSLECKNPELARLKIGPFLNELINHFSKIEDNQFYEKYRIYSAQDLNIANLLMAFEAYNWKQPPYASSLIFEFRENLDGGNFVNLLYKNSSDVNGEPLKMKIKGCAFDCDFKHLKDVLSQIIVNVTTWEKECQQYK